MLMLPVSFNSQKTPLIDESLLIRKIHEFAINFTNKIHPHLIQDTYRFQIGRFLSEKEKALG